MNDSIFFGLVYNASLLLALVLVLDFLTSKLSGGRIFLWRIATGILLGAIGLAIMHTNWELIPGVIFDTRSVLLGAAGLYFGWIPTLIAVVMTGVFRIYQGGGGVLMGVSVILEASLIGLIWRSFRSKTLHKLSWFELYIFGFIIHLGMLLCTQLLPEGIKSDVLSQIWIPVMAIYPVATVLLGSLLSNRLKRDCYVAELSESEARFHGLFESMIEGVALHEVIFNEKGEAINYKLIDVNSSYKIQTGIKSDVKNKLATEVYGTETPPYLKEFIEVAVTGKSKVIETYFEPLNRVFKIAIFSLKGGRFATVFEDITEQKKVMKLLMESEEKFSKVFKNSPMIIVLSDMKTGKIMEVNNAFEKEFGYRKEDIVGKTSKELGLWNNFDERENLIMTLGKKDSLTDKEYVFCRKNKTVFPALGSISKIVVGGATRILFLGMNIEERKNSEEKLKRINVDIMMEKRKLEAILRDMGDAVFVTDDNKKIILANRTMESLFGLTEKEMLGKSIDEELALSYETTGEKPIDLFDIVFNKKKQAKPVETLIVKNKNGTIVSVDGNASPIVDENMKLVGTIWVLRDVSKERELQKMRTDFISLASHQLRTPLTGIKWFVELLDENASKMPMDKVLEYIRKIGDSNNRMIDLVNDLMTTSRADGGKLEKDTGKYKVKDLLQQAVDEQGRIFLDKNIKIEGISQISIDIVIDADMVQMVQVFGNLLNNAASYSPSGSRIEVGAETKLSKVQIFVRDHGVGIPLSQQKKVFEKFFRADNISKTIPGSGLGLYVAKSMVESHGGKIWFESKENLGTTFFVELPIKQKDGKKEESDDRGG